MHNIFCLWPAPPLDATSKCYQCAFASLCRELGMPGQNKRWRTAHLPCSVPIFSLAARRILQHVWRHAGSLAGCCVACMQGRGIARRSNRNRKNSCKLCAPDAKSQRMRGLFCLWPAPPLDATSKCYRCAFASLCRELGMLGQNKRRRTAHLPCSVPIFSLAARRILQHVWLLAATAAAAAASGTGGGGNATCAWLLAATVMSVLGILPRATNRTSSSARALARRPSASG